MVNRRLNVEHVHAPDHVIHFAEPELGHELPHLLGHKEEEIDHVLWLPGEPLAQFRILSSNTYRTRIQMALAQHDASHCNQRRSGEPELLCSKERCDHDIAAGLKFAVGLYADATAQVVHQQNLLRLRET